MCQIFSVCYMCLLYTKANDQNICIIGFMQWWIYSLVLEHIWRGQIYISLLLNENIGPVQPDWCQTSGKFCLTWCETVQTSHHGSWDSSASWREWCSFLSPCVFPLFLFWSLCLLWELMVCTHHKHVLFVCNGIGTFTSYESPEMKSEMVFGVFDGSAWTKGKPSMIIPSASGSWSGSVMDFSSMEVRWDFWQL